MKRIAAAALAYWAGGLALGFLLGPVRVLWVAPRLGEFAAVAAELPVMLAAGWGWPGRCSGRCCPAGPGAAGRRIAWADPAPPGGAYTPWVRNTR